MKSFTAYLTFNTKKRKEIITITNDVERIIRESGVQDGLALVSAMHLTASVIIQDEESGLQRDIMEWAEQLAPVHPTYRHHQTGPGQRRCPPQKPLAASPGRLAHHQWQDRLWSQASPLLL